MVLEDELERWRGFFSIWCTEEPEFAQTERIPIWKKNKATLWYYPAKERRYKTPLYLIYSLINQPFILDLLPGNSLIEAFVHEGFDVYLIDFGIPGFEDKDLTMDDYIKDYIQKGAKKVLDHSNATELSVMGFCLGGTLAAMYASIATEPIKNLILDVAPIDFSNAHIFDQWAEVVKEEELDFDDFIDSIGLIPPKFVEAGVRLITSPIYFSPYLSLLNKANDEEYVERWRVFNKWTRGHIPLPGGVLKQMFHDFGKHNKLVKGTLKVRDEKMDLSNIHSNLLVIASEFDRLVPKETTYKIMDLVSSNDKKYIMLQGGHTGLTKDGKLPHHFRDWLPTRSNPI
ncbi:alpha/beta fold hydrolase [Robertmurraya andreesenii]|uniref:Polyhydroxyalkanoate synthase n=1 Tax=Anoxybacillus andreesenii TaxID=1325932 RepID=A0ABT9V1P0_9BACL|nr:alpha/beta fold hydrolase [Robertmurraya andreesenii]MDQ0154872.1 polyhydroxyalkanoate synthase [Robertmurraya andreesenii]